MKGRKVSELTDHTIGIVELIATVLACAGTWLALPQLQKIWKSWREPSEPTTLGSLSSAKPYLTPLAPGVIRADTATLQTLISAFAEVDLTWLHTYDFGGSFLWSEVARIRKYSWDNERAEHEFIDRELEQLRRILIETILKFSNVTALHTSTISRHGDDEVRKIPEQYQDGQYSDSRFFEKSQQINDAAEAVYDAYTNLVRTARLKLTTLESESLGGD